ncbi:hypothetical protein [Tautonia sociabilis]|uniref:Uncharacterized protein n=1 Tax=Tautonia sociabilis TaxID=2080755 RepID=A0A432MHN7_9BACT|nr:hypothetical protein [Tautonia sociabilis]RUL86322.1 hypothetical protein TsocGM_16485 [Tautonia sociabilis]
MYTPSENRRARVRSDRFRVEALESRVVPSTLSFTTSLPSASTLSFLPPSAGFFVMPTPPGSSPSLPALPPPSALPSLPGPSSPSIGTIPANPPVNPPVDPGPDDLPGDGTTPTPGPPDAGSTPPAGGDLTHLPSLPEVPPGDPSIDPPEDPAPAPSPPSVAEAILGVEPGSSGGAGEVGSVVVTFSTPIQTSSLSPRAFQLDRIRDDGSTQAIFGPDNPPRWWLEKDGTRLVLLPGASLGPGQYRLSLSGDARFTAVNGQIIDAGGTDRILGEFRVASIPADPSPRSPSVPDKLAPSPTGPTLGQAKPLGTIGPDAKRIVSTIDLDRDPNAVLLYRIDLAPGHSWRFGAEVSGGASGHPLPLRLSLFDSSGRLIASGDLGLSGSVGDPFLFAGLEPGRYFLGVSASANNPAAGGYDPITGALGAPLPAQPGGSFSMTVVADPADQPARVIGLKLDRLDPSDPRPTGFVLHFDAAVRSWAPYLPSGPVPIDQLVEVVGEDGRVWSARAESYNAGTGSMSFLLLDRLPVGSYEIRLPDSEGLVDLAGHSPVAEGMPPGVLGRFDVSAEPASRSKGNLGVLLPAEALAGVSVPVLIAPGAAEAIRFVVTEGSPFAISLDDPGGSVRMELVGPDGSIPLDADLTATNGTTIRLLPGVYVIRLINDGSEEAEVTLRLRALDIPRDSVPLNGIGQGPALGMRLISPTFAVPSGGTLELGPPPSSPVIGSQDGAVSPSSVPLTSPLTSLSPTSGRASGRSVEQAAEEAIAVGQGGPSGPGGLLMSFEPRPIGRPTTQPLRVAAVDPTQGGSLAATTSVAEGEELFRFVPVGQGQPVGRQESAAGGWSSSPGIAEAWPAGGTWPGDPDSSGPVSQPPPSAEPPPRIVFEEALDAALAMLRPISGSLLDRLSSIGGRPIAGQWAEATGSDRAFPDFDSDAEFERPEEPLEVPVAPMIGVGLVVGWGARIWSRRRLKPAAPSPRRSPGGPSGPIAEAEGLAIIDELTRGKPRPAFPPSRPRPW